MMAAANKIDDSCGRMKQITQDVRAKGYQSPQGSPEYEAAATKVTRLMAKQNQALKKLKEALSTTGEELAKTDQKLKQGATNIADKLSGGGKVGFGPGSPGRVTPPERGIDGGPIGFGRGR
jgi:hypothetical protein